MAFENDYIMRIIHEMVRTLLKLLFNIDEEKTEPASLTEEAGTSGYGKLKKLAGEGRINEAENLLYDFLDENGTENRENLKTALLFYDFLNTFDSDYLESHDFSREEIRSGIENVLSMFGYTGLTDALSISALDETQG